MNDLDARLARLSPAQREVLERLLAERGTGPAAATGGHDRAPLTHAQERLWFLEQLDRHSAAYHVPLALRLRGALDTDALERAVRAAVDRHEALRTTFEVVDGRPAQVVHPEVAVDVPVADLRWYPEDARADVERQFLVDETHRPFDLERGPLVRATLLRLAEDHHVLLVVVHHVAFDGWSGAVLLSELGALYEAAVRGEPSPLPPLPLQYPQFAAWQREHLSGERSATLLEHWREALAGVPPVLALPTDRPRPAEQRFDGARVGFAVPAALVDAARGYARARGATLFTVLLAGFDALLHRYSGQDDFAVGTPVAGRTRPELEQLVGLFANTLALRSTLEPGETFRAFADRVRDVALQAFDHQELPFEALVKALNPERSLSHTPVFQTLFALQTAPPKQLRIPGVEVQQVSVPSLRTKFDLTVTLRPGDGGLQGSAEFRSDLFDRQTVAAMATHYVHLLGAAVDDPDRPVEALPLVDDAEVRRILGGWRRQLRSGAAAPARAHERVQQQAAREPDAAAVEHSGRRLSYGELNAYSNRIARRLLDAGVAADATVALSLEPSADLVAGILAILKAGAAAVPVDPSQPPARLAELLADAAPGALLTRSGCAPQADVACPVVDLDRERARLAELPGDDLDLAVHPAQIAYVLFTSGSTGRPKGVAMPHAALGALVDWSAAADPRSLRTLQFAAPTFDVAFQELFWTWATGGTLVVPEERRDPVGLLALLAAERVQRLLLPPVALRELARAALRTGRLPTTLEHVVTAGEQLRVDGTLRAFFERLPGCTLENHYGPTETHVATRHVLPDDVAAEGELPAIGRPPPGVAAYLLDAAGRPVPARVPAEVYVGGAQVARGYHRRPALTAERFAPDPFGDTPGLRLYRTGDVGRLRGDGAIEFLGRADEQLKVRGHRVEPGEIEARLDEHPGVADSCVVGVPGGEGIVRLCAYWVPAGAPPDDGELRAHLTARLPGYMVPHTFVRLGELPRTPTGKVDRRALPAPDAQRRTGAGDAVAPRTDTERRVALVWQELLEVDRVGVHDDFFELGGDSIVAVRVTARVAEELGVELAVKELFRHPTVAGIAGAVERSRSDRGRPARGEAPGTEPAPLTANQKRFWVLQELDPDGTGYNVTATVRLDTAPDEQAVRAALQHVVDRHEALRTSFRAGTSDARPEVADAVEVGLRVQDDRGADASRAAEELAATPFDLTRAPLLRALYLPAAAGGATVVLALHHIVCDGFSLGVVRRELREALASLAVGRPPAPGEPPVQYRDYARWHERWLESPAAAEARSFWRAELRAGLPALRLPGLSGTAPAGGRSRLYQFPADPATWRRLEELCAARRTTAFAGVATATLLWLAALTGSARPYLAAPVSGRDQPWLRSVVGPLVNTALFTLDVDADEPVGETLERLGAKIRDVLEHQHYPFEEVVRELPDHGGGGPRLPLVLNMLPPPDDQPRRPAEVRHEARAVGARMDLSVCVLPAGEATAFACIYREGAFESETVQRLMDAYGRVLARLAGDPAAPAGDLLAEHAGLPERLDSG